MENLGTKTIKIGARITPGLWEEMGKLAYEVGMTKTSLASICLAVGYKAFLRMLKPEEAISPKKWVEIMEEVRKQDLNLEDTKNVEK